MKFDIFIEFSDEIHTLFGLFINKNSKLNLPRYFLNSKRILLDFKKYLGKLRVSFYMFCGNSQARTRELKKEFKLKGLKELKDRVQTVVIWVLTQDKRSMFENVY